MCFDRLCQGTCCYKTHKHRILLKVTPWQAKCHDIYTIGVAHCPAVYLIYVGQITYHGHAELYYVFKIYYSIIIILDIEYTPGCMCLYIIRVQAQVVADCLIVYNYVYFTYHYIYSIRYFQLVYIIIYCVY